MRTKAKELQRAVHYFEQKKTRTPDDYIQLFIAARKALAPADGLLWAEVKEAIFAALEDVEKTKFWFPEKNEEKNV